MHSFHLIKRCMKCALNLSLSLQIYIFTIIRCNLCSNMNTMLNANSFFKFINLLSNK